MPENDQLYFKLWRRTIHQAVAVVWDAETMLVPQADNPDFAKPANPDDEDGPRKKSTKIDSIHEVCCIALKVNSRFPEYDLPVEYITGSDCIKRFLAGLHKSETCMRADIN